MKTIEGARAWESENQTTVRSCGAAFSNALDLSNSGPHPKLGVLSVHVCKAPWHLLDAQC